MLEFCLHETFNALVTYSDLCKCAAVSYRTIASAEISQGLINKIGLVYGVRISGDGHIAVCKSSSGHFAALILYRCSIM